MKSAPTMEKMTVRVTVPLRFLGMGVYLAWIYSVQFGNMLLPSSDPLVGEAWFSISNLTNATCLIACALLAHKLAPLSARRAVPWIAATCMTAGTVLTSLEMFGDTTRLMLAFGSGLTGIGLGLIILLWAEFYSSLPTRRVTVYYSASFVLAVVLHLAIVALGDTASIVATAALPLASAAMFSLSVRRDGSLAECEDELDRPNEQPDEQEEGSSIRWSFPWRPVLLMAAYSFAFNFSRATGSDVSETSMIGVALIAAVVLVAGLFFFERFDVRHLYRLALPLMVAGMLIQPVLGEQATALSGILLNASHAGFIILTMIVLSNICYRYGVVALWLFGITRAARVVASIIGGRIGAFVWLADDPDFTLAATNLVVIGLVAACMGFLNERELESTWGITPRERKSRNGTSTSASRSTLESYYEQFVARCGQIARMYGLTRREEEVLSLLAQGKSVPKIERELYISNGTAKSHVRHIYAKLDIHSRDELVSLVGMDDPATFSGEADEQER